MNKRSYGCDQKEHFCAYIPVENKLWEGLMLTTLGSLPLGIEDIFL